MDGRKSICFVTYKFLPEWGGLARSASRLVAYLTDSGFDVHVIVPSFQQDDSSEDVVQDLNGLLKNPELGADGVYIYRPKIVNKNEMMGFLAEIILLLDMRFHFQLFHGYYLPFAFPCLVAAAHGNRPVIASIRGNDAVKEGMSAFYFPYVQSVLNRVSWITSVSSDLLINADAIADIKRKSSVIFNGIDNSNFPGWAGFEATQGVVGTVGELRFKKAIPLLVEAYSKLPTLQREKLILGGPYSDSLEQRVVEDVISSYKLENEVVSTGYLKRQQLLEQLANFNVFVVCSYHDGLPNTLLEAASCGVPIVATKVGGMLDVLVDGENALLVEPGNSQQLSEAISRLLSDKALCLKLSAGARALADRLNYDQEKASWLSLYEKLGVLGQVEDVLSITN
jgi:glycosyltransferase involved in cell wall biosynthesis